MPTNRITMLLRNTAIIAERRQEMPTRMPLQIPLPRAPEIPEGEICHTCDAPIGRFDAEVFFHTGRCGPCQDALKDH